MQPALYAAAAVLGLLAVAAAALAVRRPTRPGRSVSPATPDEKFRPIVESSVAAVFIVDAVEPCVAFWVDRFGFAAENQVPGPDGKLVFWNAAHPG